MSTRFLSAFWWFFSLVMLLLYLIELHAILNDVAAAVPGKLLGDVGLLDVVNGEGIDSGIASGDFQARFDALGEDTLEVGCISISCFSSWFLSPDACSSFQGYIYGLHSGSEADTGAASLDRLLDRPAGTYGLIIDADSALCLMCEERGLSLIADSSLSTTSQLALGYRKGFALRGRMDGLILRYFADGTMGRLRQKWFKSCEPARKTAESRRQPSPFGKAFLFFSKYVVGYFEIMFPRLPDGPFFYLLLSGIAATVIAVLELLYYVAETSRHRPGSSVWSVFKEEIGNAVRCSGGGALHSPVVMVRPRGNGHCDLANDTIVETPSSIGCREGVDIGKTI